MSQIRRLLLLTAHHLRCPLACLHLLRLQGLLFSVLEIHHSKAAHKAAKLSHQLKAPASVALSATSIILQRDAAALAWAILFAGMLLNLKIAHSTTDSPPPRRARLPHQVPSGCQQTSSLAVMRSGTSLCWSWLCACVPDANAAASEAVFGVFRFAATSGRQPPTAAELASPTRYAAAVCRTHAPSVPAK